MARSSFTCSISVSSARLNSWWICILRLYQEGKGTQSSVGDLGSRPSVRETLFTWQFHEFPRLLFACNLEKGIDTTARRPLGRFPTAFRFFAIGAERRASVRPAGSDIWKNLDVDDRAPT